ncbi:MAG TPA: DUF1918 domain-containing protein [Candidatus Dormibacteraeota bacterium]|nr:DUF1918 domain-containing protein [Candidatus Dormibacteraeota bacterium]
MIEGRVGDRLVIESERIGRPGREGVILEVLEGMGGVHYRVRWNDGHESTYFPGTGGDIRILEAAKKEG